MTILMRKKNQSNRLEGNNNRQNIYVYIREMMQIYHIKIA